MYTTLFQVVKLNGTRTFTTKVVAETYSAVQVQQEFRRRFGRAPPTPVTIRNNFKKYRDEGTSQNLCKQRSGRPNLRTIKALWHGVKLHTHHDVFQTDKWRPLFKPQAFDGARVTLSTMFIHWSMWSMTRMSSLGTIVHNK